MNANVKLLNCNPYLYFIEILLEQNLLPKYAQADVTESISLKRYKLCYKSIYVLFKIHSAVN
jgi:hypothetical protein